MMLRADQERRKADRLLAAQHAVWVQSAVARGAGMVLGSKAQPMGVWDLVPDLEPASHKAKREEARRAANVANWMAAAAFLSLPESGTGH